MRSCTINGCNNKYRSKGFCQKHYMKFRKYGDPLEVRNDVNYDLICTVDECKENHRCKGFCDKHYRRFRKYGDPNIKIVCLIRECKIDGCEEKHKARGYCHKHYQKWKKYGDPLYVKQIKICSIDGCNEKYHSKSFCQKHYDKKYRQDHPEVLLRAVMKHFKKMGGKLNISSMEYVYIIKSWANIIKKLDNHMCKNCNSKENLHAHHLFPKAEFPELSLDLNNGITLCKKCHSETHGFETY